LSYGVSVPVGVRIVTPDIVYIDYLGLMSPSP